MPGPAWIHQYSDTRFVAKFIAVTDLAVSNSLERFPGEPSDKESRRFTIAKEVSAALSEGRYSSREPKWSGNGAHRAGRTRNPKERDRSIRFVWPPDESRIYLVDRKNGGTAVVVTCIKPNCW